MPETAPPSTRKMGVFRRAYYAAGNSKTRAYLAMVKTALKESGDVGHVVREYLRLEAQQHKEAASKLKTALPAAGTDQLELPFAGAGDATLAPAQADGNNGRIADERKTHLFENIVRTALAGSDEAIDALREFLRMEARQHKLVMRMIQALTPRSLAAMNQRVLRLIDSKPDKIWPLSTLIARVVEEEGPGADKAAIGNNIRQSLHELCRDRLIRQPGRSLYQSNS